MPDDTKIDPGQTVDALRQELAALAAERDEALAERATMAEIVEIVKVRGAESGRHGSSVPGGRQGFSVRHDSAWSRLGDA